MALMTEYWDKTTRQDPRSWSVRQYDAKIDAEMPDEIDPDELLMQEALAIFDYVLARRQQRGDVEGGDLASRFYDVQSHYGYDPIGIRTLAITVASSWSVWR